MLAATLSLFVYRRTFSHGFVMFDDDVNVVLNAHMGGPTLERIRWMFTDLGFSRRYMPLGWLCFSAVYSFSGLNPLGYHVALVAFHVANAVLLFVVVDRLLRLFGSSACSRAESDWRTACALLASLWWSLNPFRVESVAWTSGLIYSQAVFFAFASLAVYLESLLVRAGGPQAQRSPSRRAPALSLALYGASLLTYPIAIGLAPVFLVVEWAARRGGGRRASWLHGCVALAMAGAAVAIALFGARHASSRWKDAESGSNTPAVARLGRAAYAFSYYIAKPWVPVGLSDAYPTTEYQSEARGPGGPKSFWNARLLTGIGCTLALAALVASWPRLRRDAGPFLLCYLCIAIPFLGLSEHVYTTVDRYSTLPCALLAAALALALVRLRGRARPLVAAGFCAYLGILAHMSEVQSLVWASNDSYYAHSSSVLAPGEFPQFKYHRPADFLIWSGRYDEAASIVAQGLRAIPNDPILRGYARDLEVDRRTYARFSQFAQVHVSQAARFMQSGEWREANEHLRLALEQSPRYYEAALYRSYVLIQLGDYLGALHELLRAKACCPSPLPDRVSRALRDAIARGIASTRAGK